MGFCVSREKTTTTQMMLSAMSSNAKPAIILDSSGYTDIQKYYQFQDVIGQGRMGTIRTAKCLRMSPSTSLVAVRSVLKAAVQTNMDVFRKELTLFRLLDHPNVIRFHEMFEDQKYLHVVMDYCSGGNISERLAGIGEVRESEVQAIFLKLVSAVSHMHQLGLCHRDLRPEHILYTSRTRRAEFKIVDFSDMTYISVSGRYSVLARCPNFMAPELFEGNIGSYGKECDIWSLGRILYFLLSGQLPFDDADETAQLYHIAGGDLTFHGNVWRNIPDAQDLIKKMMEPMPRKRLPLADVMQHPWILAPAGKYVSKSVLNSLQGFQSPQGLQRKLLRSVILHSSSKQLADLNVCTTQKEFAALDSQKTGFITEGQLQQAFRAAGILQPKITGTVHAAILDNVSSKKNGRIQYSDFLVAAISRQETLIEDTLYTAFKHFDLVRVTQDNNDLISLGEMQTALQNLGVEMSTDELKQHLQQVDQGGQIDFDSFKALVKNCRKGE